MIYGGGFRFPGVEMCLFPGELGIDAMLVGAQAQIGKLHPFVVAAGVVQDALTGGVRFGQVAPRLETGTLKAG